MAEAFKEVIQLVFETLGAEEAAKLQTALSGIGDAGGEANAKLAPLIGKLDELSTTAAKVAQAIDIQDKITANNAALEAAKKSLADLNAEFDRTDKSSADVQTAFKQAEKQVSSLTAEQFKLQTASAASSAALKAAGVDTNNLGKAHDELKAKSAAVAEKIRDTAEAAKEAAKQAKDADDVFKQLKDHLGEIVSVAAAVELALKGIEFGKESFSGAADVQQSLARVKAVAQSTAEDFARLSEQIERSATAANVGSTQAATAAAALAEQGETANEIFQTLTPTLLLARDAQIEVGQAAGIVDDALDLFGKSAGDAALVVDQLVVASKGSKDGIGGLATAMRSLAPDAKQIGLNFEQLVGLLGLMGQNGVDAEKAAKGLRTVFQQLEDPSSKLSLSLASLGDSSGNFSRAIETIRTSGKRGQDALLGLDGSARSLVLFLLQQAPGAVDAFTASLAGAEGQASLTAKTIDTSLRGSFTSFENALDRLGEGLLGTSLEPFRQELQKLADELTTFAASPDFEELKTKLATIFADGTKAFDEFIHNLDWRGFVADAKASIGEVSDTIKGLAGGLSTAASAINKTAAGVGVAFHAVAVVLTGVATAFFEVTAALGKAELLINQALDKMRGGVSATTERIESLQQAAQDAADHGMAVLREQSDKVVSGLEEVAGSADKADSKVTALGVSFENVKAGAATASDTSKNLVDDFNATTGAVENVGNALGILPELFNASGVAASNAATATKAHAEAIISARQAVADARKALDDLSKSGSTNAFAFQQAADAYKLAQENLDKLTGKADEAAVSQRALAQAFTTLKISSQAQLQQVANDFKTAFDTINKGAAQTAEGLADRQNAFVAYAKAAIAAAQNIDQAHVDSKQIELDAQASALGLTEALTKAGIAGKDGGEKTAKAYTEAREAVTATSDAAKALSSDTAASAIALDRIGASAKANAAVMGQVVALTVDQQSALKRLNEELERGGGLQNLSLQDAKALLDQLGAAAGAQTQVLLQRINDLQAAADATDAATSRMKDQADSIQDEIDQINGNDAAIEDRRHQKKLDDLNAEADADGTLSTAEYRNAVALENQLHELKQKNAQEQQATKQRQAADEARQAAAAATSAASTKVAPQNTQHTLTITLDAKVLGNLNLNDANSQRKLADLLTPHIIDSIKTSARSTGLFNR